MPGMALSQKGQNFQRAEDPGQTLKICKSRIILSDMQSELRNQSHGVKSKEIKAGAPTNKRC